MAWASSPTTVTPRPSGLSREEDLGLQRVGVLILVDEHVIEAAADRAPPAPSSAMR